MTTTEQIDNAVAIAEARQLTATGTAELIRRKAGLSLAAVARAIDVEPSTVFWWERGRFLPQGDNAVAYCELLRRLRETTEAARKVRA